MISLTTRQRDLLRFLLRSNTPRATADIAREMELTPRQVSYGLKGVENWLESRGIALKITPGVGVELGSSRERLAALSNELASQAVIQLVLTAGQRQQLLAIRLLTADEPLILYQLQQAAEVSRTSILKDLDSLEAWVSSSALRLERRPNYGIWLAGTERARRQALVSLLWGNASFGKPLTHMSHTEGLVFQLSADAHLLPLVQHVNELLRQWDIRTALEQVAYAEAQLGGRYTDDTVLRLSLVFAIQIGRLKQGHALQHEDRVIAWLKTGRAWPVATQIVAHLSDREPIQSEIADIAIHLLTGTRNGRWPGDLEIDTSFTDLIAVLMEEIGKAYRLPALSQDPALRDGLVSHIVPACLRQRFDVWTPPPHQETALSSKYAFERQIAQELADEISRQTGAVLPAGEINNIAMLLRAAFIRERPTRAQRVIVVCPSGMATAQLLVARLKARFPRLGSLRVVSMRELGLAEIAGAQLIVSTIPLPPALTQQVDVIQVHPLLLPEDVEAITQWLA